MKSILIDSKEFACVAEAVAFFAGLGFSTWSDGTGDRLMRNKDEEVRIVHRGLLDVETTHIKITL